MESFLQESKLNLKNANESSTIQIVLGNESCDLDSAISAIVMAYYIHKVQKSSDIVVPVLNVKRCELPTKTEVVFFLEETSVHTSDVICIDEIDLKALHENGKLGIVLVDHNALSVEQSYLESRVLEIVDHHSIDNPEGIKKLKTKIEPVGSCSTLIAEEILTNHPSIMDPQIAMLLYGTILLDTVGLQESAKRVTEKDKEIVTKLETFLEGISRDELFETLQQVKFDVSTLSPAQLLYKDTKYLKDDSTSLAIVSLPTLLQDVMQEEQFISALGDMSCAKDLKSIILMGVKVTDGNVKRQIAVYDETPASLKKIASYLKSQENPSLDLQQIPLATNSAVLFDQGNFALTRKFVMPAMQKYLKCSSSDKSEINHADSNRIEDNKTLDSNSLESNHTGDGDFVDEGFVNYQPESLDFPDSPQHTKLLENYKVKNVTSPGFVSVIPEPDEIDSSENVQTTGGTLKRIAVQLNVLEKTVEEDDQRSLSSLSNRSDAFSQSEDIILDDATFDDDLLDNSDYLDSPLSDPIPEMSAAEEFEKERSWRSCTLNGEEKKIDMKVIEPYRKVLSHGGYHGSPHNAIIIFSACYLPDRSRNDYDYVMDNLFMYVITTLDELVAEDYVLVYLHGATERSNMPSFGWLKRCYQMIDRRLRKNLKGLYLVHPTFWLKTIVIMTRPFISSKFTRKLRFVYSLKELSSLIPLDHVCIPDKVKDYDEDLFDDE
ncbi:hypothetical protein JTE90_006894 [Oedothorax gibbosus]|uniref:CRAL-TRIO domain-containing protein n=1 Tax=Oedothorax gibbosus TaxID=931172 RepID=A0AAV6VNA4_9ARAC|nr:hypothetical protein JTE90_006894 [Oedothorax gibbosus]